MTNSQLQVIGRRSAAVGALVLLLYLLYWLLLGSWFVGPLTEMETEKAQIKLQQQHYQALLARDRQMEKQHHLQEASTQVQAGLLPAAEPAVAAATLMNQLSAQLHKLGYNGRDCELAQQMPVTADKDPESPYREVGVSLHLKCRIRPLMAFLHRVESQRPWLIVDTLSIHRGSHAPASGAAGKLDVQLLIKGYLQRPQGGAA